MFFVYVLRNSSTGRHYTGFTFLTGLGSPSVTITSFDLKLFSQIGSITVNNVTGKPQSLIRWGQNGLAFNTDGGQIMLIGGNFVR